MRHSGNRTKVCRFEDPLRAGDLSSESALQVGWEQHTSSVRRYPVPSVSIFINFHSPIFHLIQDKATHLGIHSNPYSDTPKAGSILCSYISTTPEFTPPPSNHTLNPSSVAFIKDSQIGITPTNASARCNARLRLRITGVINMHPHDPFPGPTII